MSLDDCRDRGGAGNCSVTHTDGSTTFEKRGRLQHCTRFRRRVLSESLFFGALTGRGSKNR